MHIIPNCISCLKLGTLRLPNFCRFTCAQDQVAFPRDNMKFGPNQMLFDMGVDIGVDTTQAEVTQKIDALDQTFHLVMVSSCFSSHSEN